MEGQQCTQSLWALEAASCGHVTLRIKGSSSASLSDFILRTGPSLEERRGFGAETRECEKSRERKEDHLKLMMTAELERWKGRQEPVR